MSDTPPPPNRKGALIGLAVIVVIVLTTVLVQRHIRSNAVLEDCLLAGRRNCASAP